MADVRDDPPAPTETKIRLSLKAKLSLLITSLVVLAVAIVGLFLLRQQQQSLTAEMTKRGLTIAENFAASAKSPLLTNDELTLAVLVKEAMKDPDVAYALVADSEGKILAQSDASSVEGRSPGPRTWRRSRKSCSSRPTRHRAAASSTSRCRWYTAGFRWGPSTWGSASGRSIPRWPRRGTRPCW